MRREYKVSGGGVLPAGYAECEYIESTGTQYIDTGIVAENGFTCTAGVMYTEFNNNYILGSHNTREPWKRNGFGTITNGNIQLGCGNDYLTERQIQRNVFYEFEASTILGNGFLKVDGTQFIHSSDSNARHAEHILMFTSQYVLYVTHTETGKFKMYYIKFNVDGIKYVMVSSLRLSDNKPGMYDLCGSICPLTGTPFYVNAGSGEFLYKLK